MGLGAYKRRVPRLGVSRGPRKSNGRPEGSYRLPVLVPLLTVERPTEAPEGGEGRRLWCRRYDACLTHAWARGWSGFTCTTCDVDDEVTERERLIEAARLTKHLEKIR
jgi:hypothetical protein